MVALQLLEQGYQQYAGRRVMLQYASQVICGIIMHNQLIHYIRPYITIQRIDENRSADQAYLSEQHPCLPCCLAAVWGS
ncbi:hypothetical protein CQ007_12365 [Pseudomonas sp. MYb185]|nr:hypothetical protein CQ007_12365 [Pseudomonas sp. MYb185]